MNKGSELKDHLIGPLKIKKNEYLNILNNLGLVEKYIYDAIINGQEAPYKKIEQDTQLAKIRINKLDMYIKEIIFNNSIFINYKNLTHLVPEIKLIINAIDDDKKISELKPTINDYLKKFESFKQIYYNDYFAISNFLLEFLLDNILKIMSYFEKNINKKTANEFVIFLIHNIINMEKTSSSLREFKAALIEAIHDTNKQEVFDHDQSRMYDALSKGKKDKYSYEDVDMNPQELDAGSYNSNL